MKISFGSKELCKCLLCLGFKPKPQKASSHVKYRVPPDKEASCGNRPFVTVILGRKTYDPTTRGRYMTQIKQKGFSKKEILKCLGY